MALKDADLRPEQISYVNAHGTGTVLNDKVETLAIKRVFGDTAYRVPISSTKSMLGALHHRWRRNRTRNQHHGHSQRCAAAPTINYETSDPDCDLDYIPNTARELACRPRFEQQLWLWRAKCGAGRIAI